MDSGLAASRRPGMTLDGYSGRKRPLPRLRGRALNRGRGLAEQDGALLRGANAAEIGIDRLCLLVGAHDCGARADCFEPALEMREIFELLTLALVGHDPGIARHVGDRIIAGEERAIGELLVEHAVESVDLVAVAIDGVGKLLHGVIAEMI